MARTNSKTIFLEDIEDMEDNEIETEKLSSILDDIYDLAHDIFPEATESFHKKVGDLLEGTVNYIENITPSWEAGCDRIYNKVMDFLDGAEESSLKAVDKVRRSPIGAAINQVYKRNHRES